METLRGLVQDTYVRVGVLGAAGLGLAYLGTNYYKKKFEWTEVGYLKTIYIYPLKCGKGIELKQVKCGPRGPESFLYLDRQFAVYRIGKEEVEVMDVRGRYSKLVLLSMVNNNGTWTIKGEAGNEHTFDEPTDSSKSVVGRLLDIQLEGLDCGDDVANWISQFIGEPLRLLKHKAGSTNRIVRPKWRKAFPETFPGSSKFTVPTYADVTPYMITSETSLEDLNSKLPFPMGHDTFRPNFVVDGAELKPWTEDGWTGQIRIGEVVLDFNLPCTRCLSTKNNPATGEIYPNNEPLTTLKTFRQHSKELTHIRRIVGDSPTFGVHFSPVQLGTVRLGDKVMVRRR
ncbi:mitochondrial amidoxime-reducing component 1 [Eurytemora carolleeae]|uniref:mitochondrial amidoxime-reducing component 1 n=1 Tax=Eurytemora carolleeae TaxID=1294199 RepID=UPI000C76DE33|nr:mitochondrial amidoxime-reducing component 1 [Eurytemora carolleeae]|eukprot:XP_023324307.1 mitochondrial amidoxime-reducing component 1-like [Eurytemora affinis]